MYQLYILTNNSVIREYTYYPKVYMYKTLTAFLRSLFYESDLKHSDHNLYVTNFNGAIIGNILNPLETWIQTTSLINL